MAIAYPAIYGAPLSGTLSGTTATVQVNNLKTTSTLVLTSTGSPTIQLSMDGVNFYPAVAPTGTLASTQIYYVLTFPVRAIRFTATNGDTWAIL